MNSEKTIKKIKEVLLQKKEILPKSLIDLDVYNRKGIIKNISIPMSSFLSDIRDKIDNNDIVVLDVGIDHFLRPFIRLVVDSENLILKFQEKETLNIETTITFK